MLWVIQNEKIELNDLLQILGLIASLLLFEGSSKASATYFDIHSFQVLDS